MVYRTNEDIADRTPDHVDVLLLDFAIVQSSLWICLRTGHGDLGCNTNI